MRSIPPTTSRIAAAARRRRNRFTVTIALAFAAMLVSITLTSGPAASGPVAHGILPRTASSPALRVRPAGAIELASSAVSSTSTTTTSPPPPVAAPSTPAEDTTLLSPQDVPDPAAILPIQLIGRIQIPKIGLDTDLRDQITQESIDLGPSHWPGTAAPGGFGNAVIAGHRNSHSAPFRDLGNLAPGDTISLVAGDSTLTYTVTELFVVAPDAMWITEQTPGHTLTLFTCHPLGQSSQRLVVRSTLA